MVGERGIGGKEEGERGRGYGVLIVLRTMEVVHSVIIKDNCNFHMLKMW